jgi:RNA polymerase sigma-70 factor (ECF subfamily)
MVSLRVNRPLPARVDAPDVLNGAPRSALLAIMVAEPAPGDDAKRFRCEPTRSQVCPMSSDELEARLQDSGLSAAEREQRLAEIFTLHRDRLRFMVSLRLDPRLRARVDPSDVLQETYLNAARRLDEYLREKPMPIFLWLRKLATQRLIDLQRFHFAAEARDARREVRLAGQQGPEATSETMAIALAARDRSPSEEAMRGERIARIQGALEALEPLDREIISLRHFEGLTNAEAAAVLGLEESTAGSRFFRALRKLRASLERLGMDLGTGGGQ